MMDTDKNEERDELRGRFTRFMEICVRNARSNYCKMLSREIPTISIEDVPERLLAEEHPPEYKSGRDFDFEEEKLSEAFRTLPLMKRLSLIHILGCPTCFISTLPGSPGIFRC